jgi:adenosylcobinamide kinase/adenosylcobinamide-phosphate guanylyltransferase
MAKLVLVTGGARSGKSRFAEARVAELAPGGPWRYVATAEALDDEMRARIAGHQARRGPAWTTAEASRDPASALGGACVLVDCLTLFVSNLMLDGRSDEEVLAACTALAQAARRAPMPVVIVTNEVGWGIVPEHPLARRFRDLQGWANQAVARESDEVVLVAAGLPLRLK